MSIAAAASRKLFSKAAPVMPDRAETIPDYSIVIPVRDEAENVAPLLEEIEQAMSGRYSFEAVLVDDASVDDTAEMVRQAKHRHNWVRGFRHAEACGQSAALLTGILNIAWSALFFSLKRPDWSLFEVVFLWAAVVTLIVVLWRRARIAALLLVPYLLWVSIAAVLNLEIVRLNQPFG